MTDSNLSIFITIEPDCYSSYIQKVFHNSCRCKYFKEDFIFQHTRCNKKFKIVFQIEFEEFEGQWFLWWKMAKNPLKYYGPTKQQNGTKCKKPIKQQNNEIFCYLIPKQQNKNPIFC